MKIIRHYSQEDIKQLIVASLEDSGQEWLTCRWNVTPESDAYDHPTGVYIVEIEVEVQEAKQ